MEISNNCITIIFFDRIMNKIELASRKEYIYVAFPEVYRIEVCCENMNMIFKCYTFTECDITFLIGHFKKVITHLMLYKERITSSVLVIISCFVSTFNFKLLKDVKQIFLAKCDVDGFVHILDGREYGFEFDITYSELDLYNSMENTTEKRLRKSFELVVNNCGGII